MAKIILTKTEWYEVKVEEGDYWHEDLVEYIEEHKREQNRELSWEKSELGHDVATTFEPSLMHDYETEWRIIYVEED